MPTQITSAGITFNDTTSLTSANGVPSALKLTTARTINGVAFDGTANITVPATASGANVAKAWVNFNGTTSPGTIRSSYNISSVTYNGTGNYTVNFVTPTPMADTNYSVVGSCAGAPAITNSNVFVTVPYQSLYSTTSFRIFTNSEGIGYDTLCVNIAIFGN